MKLPRIAITTGEPAGVGPDLIVQLAQHTHAAEIIIIGDPLLLQERAEALHLPLVIKTYSSDVAFDNRKTGELIVLPIKLATTCYPGKLDVRNATYVIETLRRATLGCMNHEFSAVVTGPVHKGIINEAGFSFSGHTEFFAEQTKTPRVVMMLTTPAIRVALATTHLPLRSVADAITPELLSETLTILNNELIKKFKLVNPCIYIAGLNPHAGEQGHLGREEIDIIIPVVERLRQQGMNLVGPLPADTLFLPQHLKNADAFLTMYHDQGLPTLKYMDFDHAVNITLGLPFIRTSVDHGTALDLAGTGKANASSFESAINTAIELAQHA